jgi:hypothetical protein
MLILIAAHLRAFSAGRSVCLPGDLGQQLHL